MLEFLALGEGTQVVFLINSGAVEGGKSKDQNQGNVDTCDDFESLADPSLLAGGVLGIEQVFSFEFKTSLLKFHCNLFKIII